MAAPRSVTFDAHHFTRHARACRGQPHRRLDRSKHFWDKRTVLNAGSVVSAVAIPRTMNDGEHRNLVRWLVHHIDNDVRRFHEFARSFYQTRPTDVRETLNFQPVEAGQNASD